MRRLIDRAADLYAAFDRRLCRDVKAPIALALSGGGDSMALLHLSQAWARGNGRRLIAFTVDHRLHPESAAWTAFAGEAATALGVPWRGLDWTFDKPAAGLPAAARAARHRLLAEAAREAGASVILFAHTADDVAEGEVMRAGDAPTLGRLREWSPSPVWPEGRGLFALRPLMNARRADLQNLLNTRGARWLDDPANDDRRYARARARAMLATGVCSGRTIRGFFHQSCRRGHSVAERQDPEGGELDGLGPRAALPDVRATGDGRLILARNAFSAVERSEARRVLAMALVCVAGGFNPPRSEALNRLLQAFEDGAPLTATLAGARIVADAATLTMAREPGDLKRAPARPLSLRAGKTGVWDGRFEIAAAAEVVVAPLAGRAARLSKADRESLGRWPAAARPALPALIHDGGVALPRPFGHGPAAARPLAAARLAAACGLVSHERDISCEGMAQARQPSYVEALSLA